MTEAKPSADEVARNDDQWRGLWTHRFAPELPPTWWRNQKLKPISLEGIPFLAIDTTTNRLYWNGEEIQTRRSVRLEGWGLLAALVGAFSALAIVGFEAMRFFGFGAV